MGIGGPQLFCVAKGFYDEALRQGQDGNWQQLQVLLLALVGPRCCLLEQWRDLAQHRPAAKEGKRRRPSAHGHRRPAGANSDLVILSGILLRRLQPKRDREMGKEVALESTPAEQVSCK